MARPFQDAQAQAGIKNPRSPEILAALSKLALQGDHTQRGAVYTQAWVIESILDLVGYTKDLDLSDRRALEPAFGGGAFLFALCERLVASYFERGGTPESAASDLRACVRGVEIHEATYRATATALRAHLVRWGIAPAGAEQLCEHWLVQDDFLLADLHQDYDVIVGNPPYVRQERIPEPLLAEYKHRYKTIYDRADLYIPFYERCLDLLSPQGVLGFICSNRWVKNRYGGPLRAKVSASFDLTHYVDLAQLQAFQASVNAYPAITVLRRRSPSAEPSGTKIVPNHTGLSLSSFVQAAQREGSRAVCELKHVGQGPDPWLLDQPEQLALIRRLEAAFPTLEEVGCKVGIGVATGADRIYIDQLEDLPVEPARKLPLVMASDLVQGEIQWAGRGVVNPFMEDGRLAPLDAFPRFAAYLEQHRTRIEQRHIAKKNPTRWYRTIDRIYPGLAKRPKLLIPDIKGAANVVYDPGTYYPHHNLYVIVSETWDLRALQAVLRSSVALMFVSAYCVKMAGGYLRFQAQYLRRIRVPAWSAVPAALRRDLATASQSQDRATVDAPVFRLFGLDPSECEIVKRSL